MKWLPIFFIFFYIQTSAQSPADTITNAKAYAANYISVPVYGLTTNNKAYTVGFKLNWSGNTPLPMTCIRVNLDDKTTMAKDLVGTLSSTSFYWRHLMSPYAVLFGLNSNNRTLAWINFKDSIDYYNLGNGFYSGDNLMYSASLGIDGHGYLGSSSSSGGSTDFSEINMQTRDITKYPAIDGQDYTIQALGTPTFIYLQTGQTTFDFWSFCKSNQRKKKIWTNPTLSNAGSQTTGIFIQQPYPLWSLATDSALNVSSLTGVTTTYSEFNGNGQSTLVTFFDEITSQLFWQKNNNPIDSMDVPNSFKQSDMRRVFSDTYNKRFINYLGDYYGVWYRYDSLLQTTRALGHVGINMFDAMQVAPNKWYMIGYPSSQLLLWDSSLFWSAETFNKPVSPTTNPKQIGFGRTTSDVHEPQKLIRLTNGLFCFGGNEIRTGSTVGFNWYDSTTNTLDGMNGDHFTPRQYQDIAAWQNKMVLSTSATVNGKLFVFDGTTKTLADSLAPGFKNCGKVFIVGDRLYGIAQDTANVTQTIDSTRFYIINLSTKTVVYNQKYVGTVNTAQMMADNYIGINFTRRTAPNQPLINAALPTDFCPLRRIDNLTYNYNGANKYYGVLGQKVLGYNGITSAPIDISTYYGKYQFLINTFQ